MVQASKKVQSGPPQKKEAYRFPSRFGSHASMVQATSGDETDASNRKKCVCVDEHGSYITEVSRLDNGLADPARYATSRLGKLFANEAKK